MRCIQTSPYRRGPGRRTPASAVLRLLLALTWAIAPLLAARAADISTAGGRLTGSFDTTISLGASVRVSDRAEWLVGRENGGTANSINGDNGNLNYDRGDLVSSTGKVTHELLLRYRNLGLFCRGFYFYDAMIMNGRAARTTLTDGAKIERGRDFRLLDAYLAADLAFDSMFLTLRGGNQVLSWGESTMIPNGINSISPVDVSKLRLAGAELREGLTAVPLLNAQLSLGDRFSIDGFYQLAWDHTEIEPEGTFFSTSDAGGPGGKYIFLGFGAPGIHDNPPLVGGNAPIGTAVPRTRDRDARDDGQFGLALRWFEPFLNETEFGFYFTRLHSRLPFFSARAGTMAGLEDQDYASSAQAFRDFPEDIDTYGMSFNTDVTPLGLALQGEFSYRENQPFQAHGVELIFALLSPLDPFLDPADPELVLFGKNQLGPHEFGDEIRGYRRKEMMQAQATATKVFGPRFGGDQFILLGEAGTTIVKGLEGKEEFRYDAPGTFTGGNSLFTDAGIQPETQTDGFPDEVSWGYRLIARGEYSNAIGQINLQPQIAFAHDVGGTAPSPIGNFVEGRRTITVSLAASLLISWRAQLSYTNSFGAEHFNLRSDRDFVSLMASYSF